MHYSDYDLYLLRTVPNLDLSLLILSFTLPVLLLGARSGERCSRRVGDEARVCRCGRNSGSFVRGAEELDAREQSE